MPPPRRQRRRPQIPRPAILHRLPPIHDQLLRDCGMREEKAREGVEHMPLFHFIALQEFQPGGRVEEQPTHSNLRAHRRRHLLRLRHLAAYHHQPRRHLRPRRPRHQREMRHRRNTRQRLPPKPKRRNRKEIVRAANLRSRMPLQRKHRVLRRHPPAVVRNANQLPSSRRESPPPPAAPPRPWRFR